MPSPPWPKTAGPDARKRTGALTGPRPYRGANLVAAPDPARRNRPPGRRAPWLALALCCGLAWVAGCCGPGLPADLAVGDSPRYVVRQGVGQVAVFYATDRPVTDQREEARAYGWGERAALELGRCVVRFPAEQMAPLGRRGGVVSDPRIPGDVAETRRLSVEAFAQALRAEAAAGPRGQVLVIVHGFNNDFEHSVRGAAHFAHSVGFEGPVIIFSWPSRGSLGAYSEDRLRLEPCLPDLAELLLVLARRKVAREIHILGNSLGGYAALRTLAGDDLWKAWPREADSPRLGHLVLTAADLSTEDLKAYLPAVQEHVRRISVYRSGRDKALWLSRRLYHNGYERVGLAVEDLPGLEKVDHIEATYADHSFSGHSYWLMNRWVLMDLALLLNHDLPPQRRLLLKAQRGGVDCWIIRP